MIRYSKNKIDFLTELRTSVNEYFKTNNIEPYGNKAIIFKTAVMALLYFAPLILIISGVFTSVLPVLACWVVMGFGMSGVGMATMHDANHGSFSKQKWMNKLFGNSLYLLGGFPPNWRYQHNTLHHGYTNIEGHDEDIAPPEVLRLSPHRPLKKMHRYQYLYAWFFYSLMTISWIAVTDFRRLKRYKKEMGVKLSGKRTYRSLLIDLIVSKILYYFFFLVVPLFTVPVAWYWVVTGFLLMHFTGGLVLASIFQTAHVVPSSEYPLPDENGEIDNNWAAHQLYTTCNFAPKNRLFTWMVGGLNHQVEHHLFPNISHIHYRKIAGIVQEKAKKFGMPYHVNSSFLSAVIQHVRMLKILGMPKA
ncbi:fatty acid desaturase family protein [Maribellus maritimus]|uniref:fatty acid desaturase family protein n=1 Tax=Maribellus maritimus TaxID=2870838 RepID=UPI001EEB6352|nr:acyl-CoA desaturase [Maribellus maritimus]MCG6186552.1 acyl-CoA desaturase [Maribellus maritimus]